MNRLKISFIALITLCFSSPAYAYLDPGSGSFILQLLLASLLGTIFLIKSYWRKITRFFRRDQATDDDDEASQE